MIEFRNPLPLWGATTATKTRPEPRIMRAVTVAISEPATGELVDWERLVPALIRGHFKAYGPSLCSGLECPHATPCSEHVPNDEIQVLAAWTEG